MASEIAHQPDPEAIANLAEHSKIMAEIRAAQAAFPDEEDDDESLDPTVWLAGTMALSSWLLHHARTLDEEGRKTMVSVGALLRHQHLGNCQKIILDKFREQRMAELVEMMAQREVRR